MSNSDAISNPLWIGEGVMSEDVIFIIKPHPVEVSLHKMTLLIPNTQHPRTNSNDLIFCVPVSTEKWNKWKALSDHHKKQYQGVSYMDRVEGGKVLTLIFLPDPGQSDDDVLMALAAMRMLEDMKCRAYVVRSTFTEPSRAQIANAVIGSDPDTIMDVALSSAEHEDIDAHEKGSCGCGAPP